MSAADFFPFAPPPSPAGTAKERFDNVVTATFLLSDVNDLDEVVWEPEIDKWPDQPKPAEWYTRVMRWYEPAYHPHMALAAMAEADRFRDAYYAVFHDDDAHDAAHDDLHRRCNLLIDPRYQYYSGCSFLPAIDLGKDQRLCRWGEVTGRLIYCGGRSIEARFNSSPWLNPYFDLPRRERLSRYEKHISEMIPNAWRLATSLYGKLPALWRDGEPDEADVLHDLHAAAEVERAMEKGDGRRELASLRRQRQPEPEAKPVEPPRPVLPPAVQLGLFDKDAP